MKVKRMSNNTYTHTQGKILSNSFFGGNFDLVLFNEKCLLKMYFEIYFSSQDGDEFVSYNSILVAHKTIK